MAVSIDTVYQRVLTLVSKENRGYVTPQEFNLLANQAQMEIFEQYFYDINQYNRVVGNTQEYSDMLTVLYEKLGEFEVVRDQAWMALNMPEVPTASGTAFAIPRDEIYRVGQVFVGNNATETLNRKDFDAALLSPLTAPSITSPIANISGSGIRVAIAGLEDNLMASGNQNNTTFATPALGVLQQHPGLRITYTMRPSTVQWAYVIVNDKPLYNDNISVDFELHASEETELVYKILKLAGVNLKAGDLTQVGEALEQAQIQQQKQ